MNVEILLIQDYLTSVITINVWDCKQITDSGLAYLSNIINIDLSVCKKNHRCRIKTFKKCKNN